MKKSFIFMFIAAVMAVCSCGGGGDSSSNVTPDTDTDSGTDTSQVDDTEYLENNYSNPVIRQNCPDPTILDDRARTGYFYAYSTRSSKYLPIYRSTDMINWEAAGDGFPDGQPDWVEGAYLWAPDINYVNGEYLLYYTMGIAIDGSKKCAIGVAVSDSPTGPFQDKGEIVSYTSTGVICSIDPALFIDDDGKKYLYWGGYGGSSGGIHVVELSDDCLSVKSGSTPIKLTYGNMEGTYVTKHNGYYFMFNSKDDSAGGKNSTYHIVVSRSSSPTGPFLGPDGTFTTDEDFDNTIMSSSTDFTFTGTGHNSQIITDDAGQCWMAYHSYWKGNNYNGRCMMLGKIIWKNGPWPIFSPSHPTDATTEGPKWKKTE